MRDEEITAKEGEKAMGLLKRKKEAAKALVAVIDSAADNIHGGLYDELRGSVVHVDGLLALLGEATVFVNRKLFTPSGLFTPFLASTLATLTLSLHRTPIPRLRRRTKTPIIKS